MSEQIIESFNVTRLEVLDPLGNADKALLPPLSSNEIRKMYECLVLTRAFDERALSLQREGRIGTYPSLLGQEAAQIGAGRALKPQDYVFPTYREHGVAWCRGVNPLNLLGLFRGVNHGGWDPNEKNFHLYTIVIGAQTLHATGYAMGVQRDGAVGTGDDDRDTAARTGQRTLVANQEL